MGAKGLFWSQDYSQRCYSGRHLALALGYGLPWLTLFCIGVPVITALLLYRY